jgi:hypothetical protein
MSCAARRKEGSTGGMYDEISDEKNEMIADILGEHRHV